MVGLVRDRVPQSLLWSSSGEFAYIAENLNIVHGCLEDFPCLERTINEYECEIVFHLGAQTIVGIANRNPLSTFESNIRGTYNLLEACRKNSPLVKAIITASSDKAYGCQEELPYDESDPLKGTYPYDVSKSCSDLIGQTYAASFGLPISITRCGNFFGPGDLNFNRIIPQTIRHILRNERPIIRSDGKFVRDYLYVKDGALAYKHLAEKMAELSLSGEAFNFSNEAPATVVELVYHLMGLMGREDLEPIVQNKASNEIREQYLSAKKAREILDWTPFFPLEEGLRETIGWYRDFLK